MPSKVSMRGSGRPVPQNAYDRLSILPKLDLYGWGPAVVTTGELCHSSDSLSTRSMPMGCEPYGLWAVSLGVA